MFILDVRSHFELLKSTLSIDEIVEYAKENGYTSVAIADEYSFHYALKLRNRCIDHDIKPIYGITIWISDGIDDFECQLYAKSNKGFRYLMYLTSRVNTEQLQVVPIEWLQKIADEIVIVARLATESCSEMLQQIDSDYIYIDHLSKTDAFEKIYVETCRYLDEADQNALKALAAMDEHMSYHDVVVKYPHTSLHHMHEIIQAHDVDHGQLINMTEKIEQLCTVDLSFDEKHLPRFTFHPYETSDEALNVLLKHYINKMPFWNEDYEQRLQYELEVIREMGFSDYFLIVHDIIAHCRKNQIYVGPGRGSSAGSLVCYTLGITQVDPLEHQLLFERFLNKERVTMPDIDIDFEDRYRQKVVNYIVKRYGEQHVANIVTYTHLTLKGISREIARILKLSKQDVDMIVQWINKDEVNKVSDLLQKESFVQWMNEHELIHQWFTIAQSLEGIPKNTGTHAAGVVVTGEKIIKFTPLLIQNDALTTGWDMNEVEQAGLLKIDILGLKNLTMLHRIVDKVNQYDHSFKLNQMNMEDSKVYELIADAKTMGVFQLESDGMRAALKQVKPKQFSDVVAVIALFRPGPMEQITTFSERLHHASKVEYLHNDLKPILEETQGIIVYQEQIMQIANKIAAFNYAEADLLRRAMSKKNKTLLQSYQKTFVRQAVANGYDESLAIEIYHLIEKFANYGFNKSHSVAYSKIIYQLAYLKVHHPHAFYTEALNLATNDTNKTMILLQEAKSLGLKIYGPSVSYSTYYYSTVKDGIRMPLKVIKHVGPNIAKDIIKECQQGGTYRDLFDFTSRLKASKISRSVYESLIYAGAMDEFGVDRATLLRSLDQAMSIGSEVKENSYFNQVFTPKKNYVEGSKMDDKTKLNKEIEVLGIYVSNHPVELYDDLRREKGIPMIAKVDMNKFSEFIVYIEKCKVITTKNNREMAFLELYDGVTTIDGVVFPDQYFNIKQHLDEQIIIVYGKKQERNGREQIVVHDIKSLPTSP